MFALPKGEHFEKQIFVQYGIDLTNHIYQYNILSPISIDFNICKFGKFDRKRASLVGVQVQKSKKSELDRYRALFFFPWGLPPPAQLGTKCNPYNYNTQFFTKTSQELPIMSRSLSDCQEVTLMVTLLGDFCGMISLIRYLQKSILHVFGLI